MLKYQGFSTEIIKIFTEKCSLYEYGRHLPLSPTWEYLVNFKAVAKGEVPDILAWLGGSWGRIYIFYLTPRGCWNQVLPNLTLLQLPNDNLSLHIFSHFKSFHPSLSLKQTNVCDTTIAFQAKLPSHYVFPSHMWLLNFPKCYRNCKIISLKTFNLLLKWSLISNKALNLHCVICSEVNTVSVTNTILL